MSARSEPNVLDRRWRLIALSTLLAAFLSGIVCGDDWPTYQHDAARSGMTSEPWPDSPVQAWSWRSRSRPQPAWDEPARWDGYHKTYNLKNRQVYDKVFHVAAVGDAVYFGSSVEDALYCLDAESGQVRWKFYAEGPIRLAPFVAGNRVYFGSDDGYAYCLDAEQGSLAWKHRAGPQDLRVPGNERVISLWPVRTSVVVIDGTAYCCAGVFPSETVYLTALDADTGAELWQTSIDDLPAQGYMLASPSRVYVTTGRSRPVVFDRADGKRLHQAEGSASGTYALLTGDTLMYGPGRTGEISVNGSDSTDQLATFSGNHMVVTGPRSYLHTDDDLSALDRARYIDLFGQRRELMRERSELAKQLKEATEAKQDDMAQGLRGKIDELAAGIKELTESMQKCFLWKAPCDYPLSLILVGDVLLTGGADGVGAFRSDSGEQVWNAAVQGNAYGLAAANGRVYVSTDAGAIHCFAATSRANGAAPRLQVAAQPEPSRRNLLATDKPPASYRPYPGVHGPFLEFVSPGTVEVTWRTDKPTSSVVEWKGRGGESHSIRGDAKSLDHAVRIEDLERETIYEVRVGGDSADGDNLLSESYEFDSTLEYLPPVTPATEPPFAADELDRKYKKLAAGVVAEAGVRRGYALVLGGGEGRLAYELASQTDLNVIVVEPDADRVKRLRKTFDRAGLHGRRISVHHGEFDDLPFGPYLANVIVSESMLTDGEFPGSADEVYKRLRPSGGVLYLGQWAAIRGEKLTSRDFDQLLTAAPTDQGTTRFVQNGGLFCVHRRGALPGAGYWTHQYGPPDNSSCSQDDLVRGELSVLWWGRPGARPMPDRGNRNPAPVSAGGRLYVQGNRTLFGLDAYNGTILWAKQIPTMRRANMPRDGTNMIATHDILYLALDRHCAGFDGQTGKKLFSLPVPRGKQERAVHWGFLAAVGDTLIGSAVPAGSHYLGDEGEWFEDFRRNEIARVTSNHLYALDRHTGKQKWLYDKGVVINSTITLSDGLLYFVESRNPEARTSESGQQFEPVQSDQHLVALELDTGEVRWEKPYDFSQCEFMTYMSHGSDTLLVIGSDREKKYHMYAFDSRTGYEIWTQDNPARKSHHSGHLAHPVIIGQKIYHNKQTFDLRTGNVLEEDDFDWHGCGVMSASNHTIFRRYEFHGLLDLDTGKRTEFQGIRGGCWLSLIPSGGVLLAPETGAGCHCTHGLQTSVAYVPVSVLRGGGGRAESGEPEEE